MVLKQDLAVNNGQGKGREGKVARMIIQNLMFLTVLTIYIYGKFIWPMMAFQLWECLFLNDDRYFIACQKIGYCNFTARQFT